MNGDGSDRMMRTIGRRTTEESLRHSAAEDNAPSDSSDQRAAAGILHHPTKLLSADDIGLVQAAQLLAEGHLVGVPTETVYGLAANAFNETAIVAVFTAKERPSFDPLIVHVLTGSLDELVNLKLVDHGRVAAFEATVERLATLWPGPLTLVLPRGPGVSDLITSGLDRVALRVPAHPVARRLLELSGPFVAPSANRFGRISPTNAQAVLEELDGRIAAVIDGGATPLGIESTIVALEADGGLSLLRPGATAAEEIERVTGKTLLRAQRSDGAIVAPGMLASHYAPRKPLSLVDDLSAVADDERVAYLLWNNRHEPFIRARSPRSPLRVLSPDGSAETAARSLFQAMRELDAIATVTRLCAEPPPNTDGIAYAIQDRLQRAAAPRSPSAL